MKLVLSTLVSQTYKSSVSQSFKVSSTYMYFDKSTTSHRMSNSVLPLMLGISALTLVSPVSMIPVQSGNRNSSSMSTTAPDLEHFPLNAMLSQLIGAKQTIAGFLSKHVKLSY